MANIIKILLIVLLLSACVSSRPPLLPEDELVLTRTYVGNFVESKLIPQEPRSVKIMRIKTTNQSNQIITIYTPHCDFKVGEQLYLKREYSTRHVWGDWEYRLENDNKTYYKICQFDFKNKMLTQSWY